MNNSFDIRISSDLEYEDLVADIYFQGNFVLSINQEKGFENLEAELSSSKDQGFYKIQFPLVDLLEVIEHAKTRLWELRKDS